MILSANVYASRCSRNNFVHHVAVDVGQANVASSKTNCPSGVIETHQVQDSRLKVVNVNGLLDHSITQNVRLVMRNSGFYTTTRHLNRL